MGENLVAETSDKLHILTRLSARENLIEFGVNFYVLLSSYLCSRAHVGAVG
jgi:hypothetical protein